MKTYALLLVAVLLVFISTLSYAQAPVPFISQPFIPDAAAPGDKYFTLTVDGSGFVSSSVINWDGGAQATQFVSGSQLTPTVPAAGRATMFLTAMRQPSCQISEDGGGKPPASTRLDRIRPMAGFE